jgi:methylase of polypeptide subunit release factors
VVAYKLTTNNNTILQRSIFFINMASFSFNFFDDKETNNCSNSTNAIKEDTELSSQSNGIVTVPSPSLSVANEIVLSIQTAPHSIQQVNIPNTDLSFYVRRVTREAEDTSVVKVALERDVLTGVYEGGFKVWECAIDLIQYLHLNGNSQLWANTTVLEAGCGVGLPAIYALQQCAKTVFFQDLNVEVLKKSTQAAVALNSRTKEELTKWCGCPTKDGTFIAGNAQYIAGDWDSWTSCCSESNGVDIILSTDTLYAKPQIKKLTRLIHRLLRRAPSANDSKAESLPFPCAYIAAKRYYFGTDGGTYTFEQLLQSMPPVVEAGSDDKLVVLSTKTVHSIQDNASNIRDILCVSWTRKL